MGAIHHNTNSMHCAGGAFGLAGGAFGLAGGAFGRFASVVGTSALSRGWATAIDFGKTRIVPPAAETRAP